MSTEPNVELTQLGITRRPDPFFKLLTEDVAVQVGLKRDSTQLPYPQITTTDLVFNAPPTLNLKETLFEFFRAINNIEFKSQNDSFTLRDFVLNSIQTFLLFTQRREPNLKNFLSVIVSSRLPEAFLAEAKADDLDFTPDPQHPWLRFQKVGLQNVVIVVCRDLPIEERYYPWLLFAPTDSAKWQNFIRHLYDKQNLAWLDRAKEFRPMEVNMITKEMIQKIRAEQPLEEQLEFQRRVTESEEMLKETLRTLPPRLLLEGLSPKERLEGLAPQERLEGLSPSEIAATLPLEVRLEGLAPQERLEGLAPQERLEGLSPEQRQALLQFLQEQAKKPQE